MLDFESYRPLLFAIAYRMTGSAGDAEDLVQDAYLRALAAPATEVRAEKAYLTTIVTRLALDHLKSARVRREQYVGPWLPEPLLTSDPALAPEETVERRESLSLAFLVLLESLTPPERAVFLLREVFDYPYAEIASALEISTATCRQLDHRARAHLAAHERRFAASPEAHRMLTERFLAASLQGDLAALTELLAEDVVSWSDGGGKVSAARRPIVGRDAVLRLLAGLLRKTPTDLVASVAEINALPALLLSWDGELRMVTTYEFESGRLRAIRSILNPDKLRYLVRQLARVAGG
jgi:RNA polymerase sigma-70 factor (ECF subfamily)